MENKFIQLTGKRESDGILLPVSRVMRWDMSDGRIVSCMPLCKAHSAGKWGARVST